MSETSDQGMDPLVAGRREHHQEILESGGYPHRYERTHSAAELHETFAGLAPGSETDTRVTVAGRLMLLRSFGKLQFGTLQDDTGTIQLFVDRSTIGDEKGDGFARVDLGDWLGATGTIMTTRKGELSVRADDFTILQKSLRPLPEKWHGLQDIELRSRRRYLDLIVNADARRVARAQGPRWSASSVGSSRRGASSKSRRRSSSIRRPGRMPGHSPPTITPWTWTCPSASRRSCT